ncbi:MAG: NFACT family protein [Eubacterium sp.]|nr:NFACT family protein [Eubacterium sp.]
MAYDGIVISGVIKEIKDACLGGRVVKIQQPTSESITLTIKGFKGQTKVYISASPGLPIVYLADKLPQAPMQAPAFCMLLRKHLSNGRLVDIKQPGFDRIYDFVFEHLDEMGDLGERHLIIEIMGRQSNIILTDSDMVIMDSIKRVMPDLSEAVSKDDDKKIRIIYPGQVYEYPDSQGKINPLDEEKPFDRYTFEKRLVSSQLPIPKAIYTSITGFSKSAAEYITASAGVDGRKGFGDITVEEKDRIYDEIQGVIARIKAGEYTPGIIYSNGVPKDYIATLSETDIEAKRFDSISELLIDFYNNKEKQLNVRNKSADIKKVVQSAIERTSRKYDLQLGQLKDTEDRDKYRIYGELLNTYGYELQGGEKSLRCTNYYDNQEIDIPLDEDLSAKENAQKYFAKYNKKKRTFEVLSNFIVETKAELEYLLSVKHSLEIAETDSDIADLRRELEETSILKKKGRDKGDRRKEKGRPLHFISSEGYDIFVGKNNIQNDELTFNIATGKDLWFHAKQMPGSHVIVKLKSSDKGLEDVPDSVFEEAASLAAFYSSGSAAPKVEIDYTERKNLKKPPQAKPGYVIYHTNYSMMAEPKTLGLEKVAD